MVVVPLSVCPGVPVELAERVCRVSVERRWAIGATETAVLRLASATRPAEQPARAVTASGAALPQRTLGAEERCGCDGVERPLSFRTGSCFPSGVRKTSPRPWGVTAPTPRVLLSVPGGEDWVVGVGVSGVGGSARVAVGVQVSERPLSLCPGGVPKL